MLASEEDGLRGRPVDATALALDDDWQQADTSKPVVVVVHGYNSSPEQNQAMLACRSARPASPAARLPIPTTTPSPTSAQLLSSELRRFADEHPERRVVLVCHSMGGLVARACVEDSLYDPGNVDRLIMIAPPTLRHGRRALRGGHRPLGTLASRDGAAAPGDGFTTRWSTGWAKRPTSFAPARRFSSELNSRPRNPRVQYSVILGTGARID